MSLLSEFKAFILRGNVVDLAIAVIIGVAFTAVVDALVADIITPLIAAVGGEPSFGALHFTINGSRFAYGDFLNQVISFVIVAAVVFFFVVKPVGALLAARSKDPESAVRDCPRCTSAIPKAATRCAFCTSDVTAAM